MDGTLIEAWASTKSFRPKDTDSGGGPDDGGGGRNAPHDFHGEKRSNQTHASSTDPDARLYRKGRGKPARLCYMGHVLMENRKRCVDLTAFELAGSTSCISFPIRRDTDHFGRPFRFAA